MKDSLKLKNIFGLTWELIESDCAMLVGQRLWKEEQP